MTPLEKLLEHYRDDNDRICWGNKEVTLGELRAFSEDHKQLIITATMLSVELGKLKDQFKELKKEQRGTCRECIHFSIPEDLSHSHAYFYCQKVFASWHDLDGLRCDFFQPRKKKVRKARWGRCAITDNFYTEEEAKKRFGEDLMEPLAESWKEVEE